MNGKQDIDDRIDAALAAQVHVPKLDRQFDAAVWRRIEAEKHQVAVPALAPMRGGSASRWLRAGNAASLILAAVVLVYFGLKVGGGVVPDLAAGVNEAIPTSWLTPASWGITACALIFGLRFTRLGRWLRAEWS